MEGRYRETCEAVSGLTSIKVFPYAFFLLRYSMIRIYCSKCLRTCVIMPVNMFVSYPFLVLAVRSFGHLTFYSNYQSGRHFTPIYVIWTSITCTLARKLGSTFSRRAFSPTLGLRTSLPHHSNRGITRHGAYPSAQSSQALICFAA
jgi:hypothetical protein